MEPPQLLVGDVGDEFHPVFSPDGRRLAWTEEVDDITTNVWLASADGKDRRQVPMPDCTPGAFCGHRWPSFSRDGTRLAFWRATAHSSCTAAERCDEIVIHSPDSGSMTPVAYGKAPAWSPVRDEIVYAGSAGPAARSECEAYPCEDQEIRIVDLSGDRPVSRSVGGVIGTLPRFSPDGEWIAFERAVAAGQTATSAAVMRRDGSELRDLPACSQPNWAPDGRLACLVAVDGGSDVFVLDADDSPHERLTFTQAVEAQFQLYAD